MCFCLLDVCFSVAQLCLTPWTAAHQASLSFTNSWTLLKLMSTESVMPSPIVPFSSCLQSLPASGSFLMSRLSVSLGQNIGASTSASVLPMKYSGLISCRMDWFDFLAVQETLKSLLQHHSSKASIFLALSLLYGQTLTSIHDY